MENALSGGGPAPDVCRAARLLRSSSPRVPVAYECAYLTCFPRDCNDPRARQPRSGARGTRQVASAQLHSDDGVPLNPACPAHWINQWAEGARPAGEGIQGTTFCNPSLDYRSHGCDNTI